MLYNRDVCDSIQGCCGWMLLDKHFNTLMQSHNISCAGDGRVRPLQYVFSSTQIFSVGFTVGAAKQCVKMMSHFPLPQSEPNKSGHCWIILIDWWKNLVIQYIWVVSWTWIWPTEENPDLYLINEYNILLHFFFIIILSSIYFFVIFLKILCTI